MIESAKTYNAAAHSVVTIITTGIYALCDFLTVLQTSTARVTAMVTSFFTMACYT
jgi:hypothetical protein